VSKVDLLRLRSALETSWDSETSYDRVMNPAVPALGQCYPTARVVQHFFPETEIAEGEAWTGRKMEKHFWNVVDHGGTAIHIDLTWQRFPFGSSVTSYVLRDRSSLQDSTQTLTRVKTLLRRVEAALCAAQKDPNDR
jgi:hypothetical protein